MTLKCMKSIKLEKYHYCCIMSFSALNNFGKIGKIVSWQKQGEWNVYNYLKII